jgi:hypothetical protein
MPSAGMEAMRYWRMVVSLILPRTYCLPQPEATGEGSGRMGRRSCLLRADPISVCCGHHH